MSSSFALHFDAALGFDGRRGDFNPPEPVILVRPGLIAKTPGNIFLAITPARSIGNKSVRNGLCFRFLTPLIHPDTFDSSGWEL
jgi:hypothetical protein